MNKHFLEILDKSRAIHDKKAADYTTDPNSDPHENFTRGNEIAAWFPSNHKSYAVLVATKLARLGALLTSGRTANNESLDDTFLDLLTYVGLWYSYYKDSTYPILVTDNQYRPESNEQHENLYRGLTRQESGPTLCLHHKLNTNRRCIRCNTVVPGIAVQRQYRPSPDGYSLGK